MKPEEKLFRFQIGRGAYVEVWGPSQKAAAKRLTAMTRDEVSFIRARKERKGKTDGR